MLAPAVFNYFKIRCRTNRNALVQASAGNVRISVTRLQADVLRSADARIRERLRTLGEAKITIRRRVLHLVHGLALLYRDAFEGSLVTLAFANVNTYLNHPAADIFGCYVRSFFGARIDAFRRVFV